MAGFLGVTLTTDEAATPAHHLDYSKMKKNDSVNLFSESVGKPIANPSGSSNFIRKGISQQWKTEMSQTLIKQFDEWSREHIEGTDFPIHRAC